MLDLREGKSVSLDLVHQVQTILETKARQMDGMQR